MKHYIFWPVLILIILVGGYWMANNGIPVADKEHDMSDVIIRESNLKRAARSPDANPQSMSSSSSQVVFPQQANKEAIAYDLNDSIEREQLAASLRTEKVPEVDIQHILRRSTEEPSPAAIKGAEAENYDLNDPIEREQLAASLRTEGVPEVDIQHILKSSTAELSPAAIEGAEAQTYDTNDPFEREQLAASLRNEGITEGEFQKILRNSPGNEAPQN